ncbi:MAG TPA: hypothetical protein VGG29_14275 [Caulobacteraceae bacterium]|jgi:hypothetical protein
MRFRPALLTIALAVTAAAPARAADGSDPKALQLMAQLRALSGGGLLARHAAFHEAGTVLRDGKAGTYEVYTDLHSLRYAATHVIAGTPGGGGFDGRVVWRLGPDGKVTTTTDPKAIAQVKANAALTLDAVNRPEAFPATFRYLGRKTYKAQILDVVEVRPETGGSAELWLDRRTHHLRHVAITEGKESGAIDLWNDRVVDGAVVAFKNHQVEGPHRTSQTLKTYEFIALDPRRFAPPGSTDQHPDR